MSKTMKQVILHIKKNGRVQILAHGLFGEGTEDFTLDLANRLGEITERHEGHHHNHVSEEITQHAYQKVSNT